MKNILSSLTDSEKRRITEMHKNATKRNYLKEAQDDVKMCKSMPKKPTPKCSELGIYDNFSQSALAGGEPVVYTEDNNVLFAIPFKKEYEVAGYGCLEGCIVPMETKLQIVK
jgi:hypothetical protein